MDNPVLEREEIPLSEWDSLPLGMKVWVTNSWTPGEIRELIIKDEERTLMSITGKGHCTISEYARTNIDLRIYRLTGDDTTNFYYLKNEIKQVVDSFKPGQDNNITGLIELVNKLITLK